MKTLSIKYANGRRRKGICIIVSLVLLMSIFISACSSSNDPASAESQSETSPESQPKTSSESQPKTSSESQSDVTFEKLDTLKVAASDFAYIAQEKGWFKNLEDQGVKVELVQGTLGNEVQLIDRGELHFAGRMIYPYLLFKSQGADLTAVQVSKHPDPKIISILVKADSPYKTFDDLKGKKICSWRAGCPYIGVFEIAEDKGWKQGVDWEYVNVPSAEQNSALLSGEVDAISVHPLGEVANLLKSGQVREIANVAEDSVYVNGGGVTVVFTSTKFANEYPNITKEYLRIKRETESWILDNQDEAAAIIEGITRVPAEASETAWSRMSSTWPDSSLTLDEIKQETKALQDWLIEHKDIDAGKAVDSDDLFDPDYF